MKTIIIRQIITVLLYVVLPMFSSTVQHETITNSPISYWVKPVEDDLSSNVTREDVSEEGVHFLLYEQQENPELGEQFIRVKEQMLTEVGVQDSGTIQISFYPEFQKLILHNVNIYRSGQVLDKLDLSKIELAQQEFELDVAQQTALISVDDLRVGDILEYSYTRRGDNPATKDHVVASFKTCWDTEVDRLRFRILAKESASLYVRKHSTDVSPKILKENGVADCTWDIANSPAIICDDLLPYAFEPFPYIEISDFSKWESVAQWAYPLYKVDQQDVPDDLRKLIYGWMKETVYPDEWALKALQFVQDKVRYTGVELGPVAFQPAHPAETFRLRYGDCKEKAMLLCLMLGEMNITAWPALVNTELRHAVTDRLPSHYSFDHVIVKAKIDGKYVWLDPSFSHQGGDIFHRYMPDYGYALVIDGKARDLQSISQTAVVSSQKAKSSFVLKDYKSPISFTTTTTYQGWEADNQRNYLTNTKQNEISKKFLNYFAFFYNDIEEIAPLEIDDDRENNRLTITAEYSIKDMWQHDEKSKQVEAVFVAEAINNVLQEPKIRTRSMPLALPYPINREQTIAIHLPDDEWDIPHEAEELDSDLFIFERERDLQGKELALNLSLQTKTNIVAVSEIDNYLIDRAAVQNLAILSLFRKGNVSLLDDINSTMMVIAALGMIVTIIICIAVWFISKKAPVQEPPIIQTQFSPLKTGIGGWLALLAIGICVSPIVHLATIIKGWSSYFSLSAWQTCAEPGGLYYHSMWSSAIILELLGTILFIGLSILLIIMFFRKHRGFPITYIIYCILIVLVSFAVYLMTLQIPILASNVRGILLVGEFVSAVAWCLYVARSKRVKRTFVK